jgi:hypothetical protein
MQQQPAVGQRRPTKLDPPSMELDVLKRSLCQGYLRYRLRIMLKDLAERVFGAAEQSSAARRNDSRKNLLKNLVIVL